MIRPFFNKNKTGEPTVQNGLAVTPSEMMSLTAKGRAVSAGSLESVMYYDNPLSPLDMPLENHRGIDINDLYQASASSKKKMRQFGRAVAGSVNDNKLSDGRG